MTPTTTAPPPWYLRIKYHPIFAAAGSTASADLGEESGLISYGNLRTALEFADLTLGSAAAPGESFMRASTNTNATMGKTRGGRAPIDDLAASFAALSSRDRSDHIPLARNLLTVAGSVLAVIVDGQVRVVDLVAVKRASDSIPDGTERDLLADMLVTKCPYHVVTAQKEIKLDFAVLHIEFSGNGRFLAVIGRRDAIVLDFRDQLAVLSARSTKSTVADSPYPVMQVSGYDLGAHTEMVTSAAPLVTSAWHPLSSNHADLAVVRADGVVFLYNVLDDISTPYTIEYALARPLAACWGPGAALDDDPARATVVTARFGIRVGKLAAMVSPSSSSANAVQSMVHGDAYTQAAMGIVEHAWDAATLWVATADGQVNLLCPVMPLQCRMTMFEYKSLLASRVLLPTDSLTVKGLSRYLSHIDSTLPAKFRVASPAKTAPSPLRKSAVAAAAAAAAVTASGVTHAQAYGSLDDDIMDDEDDEEADTAFDLVGPLFHKTDATTHVDFECPFYSDQRAASQPLVMEGAMSLAMEDLGAQCTDMALVTALLPVGSEAGDDTPSSSTTTVAPVVAIAYAAGTVDVVATAPVFPRWGAFVRLSHGPRGCTVPDLREPLAIEAFVAETIALTDVPTTTPLDATSRVRLQADPKLVGHMLVSHTLGVHQVVLTLGSPAVASHALDSMPLRSLAQPLAPPEGAASPMGASFALVRPSSNLAAADRSAPVHAVVGLIATADPLLEHAAVALTPRGAVGMPLYQVGATNPTPASTSSSSAKATAAPTVLADIGLHDLPLSLPILAHIPDTYPTVDSLGESKDPDGSLTEKQYAYLREVQDRVVQTVTALVELSATLEAVMARSKSKQDAVETLVRTLAFSTAELASRVDQAETHGAALAAGADALLQQVHDATNPTMLTAAERAWHREVFCAWDRSRDLAERTAKVLAARDRYLALADTERKRAEEAAAAQGKAAGWIHPTTRTIVVDVLDKQSAAIDGLIAEVRSAAEGLASAGSMLKELQ
ncbi:hypothetical protein BC828DRAFT_390527 [Blastocladiella britannica]|nr:hypothetical protein BC828DRAFT_390527 [Blastocladiella britannica]